MLYQLAMKIMLESGGFDIWPSQNKIRFVAFSIVILEWKMLSLFKQFEKVQPFADIFISVSVQRFNFFLCEQNECFDFFNFFYPSE